MRRKMQHHLSHPISITWAVSAAVFAFLYSGNMLSGTPGIILVVLAAAFLLTSLFSFYPRCVPLRIN